MLVTLDLPTELEQQLQSQADREQLSLNELVEKILTQTLPLETTAELTIEAIEERYVDAWVVVEITEFDDVDEPTKGRVMAHHPQREELTQAIQETRRTRPEIQLYTFYTGDPIPEEAVVIV